MFPTKKKFSLYAKEVIYACIGGTTIVIRKYNSLKQKVDTSLCIDMNIKPPVLRNEVDSVVHQDSLPDDTTQIFIEDSGGRLNL